MSEPPLSVLLISDDMDQRESLWHFLQQHGVTLTIAPDTHGLAARIETERPALVVLDLMLPVVDTLAALKALRSHHDPIPVMLLAAHSIDIARVMELDLGVDDYLGKPIVPQELLARIHHVMRGSAMPARHRDVYRFGPFALDFATRTLFRDRTPLHLTGGEYALLAIFAKHAMQPLSRTQLVALLHGPDALVTERGIDVPVYRLRRLLEDNPAVPRRIQTLRGIGYMFVPDGAYFL